MIRSKIEGMTRSAENTEFAYRIPLFKYYMTHRICMQTLDREQGPGPFDCRISTGRGIDDPQAGWSRDIITGSQVLESVRIVNKHGCYPRNVDEIGNLL